MNRGEELLGWDTDQFPNNLQHVAMALYEVLRAGGLTTGGLNFDAKLRRQSIDPDDLVWSHATAMDLCARGLLVAEAIVSDGALQRHVDTRYAGWDTPRGQSILRGEVSLAALAEQAEANPVEPQPRSAGQERIEHLVSSYL